MRPSQGLVVLLSVACGPSVATSDGDADDGLGDTTTSGAEASSGAEDQGAGPTATTNPEPADTGSVQDVCAFGDPAACPEGCYPGTAWQVLDDACSVNGVEVCLPSGPEPGLPLTTYWALAPSGPLFAEYGSECSVAAQPIEWRECSGAADEPADCACFCQAGYCRGDEDRRVLDACGFDSPCESLFVDPQFGASDHDAEFCVLEGLGVRTPGVYEIITQSSFSLRMTRFYVFDDGEVERIELESDDLLNCPRTSDWGASSRCTLASGAFFAQCTEPQPKGGDCVLALDTWVSDCIEQPPSCE